MPQYRVTLETIASVTVEVEAEDKDAAVEEAFNEAPSGVCAQCSGWGQEWSMDMGEWDTPKANDGKSDADWAWCEEVGD